MFDFMKHFRLQVMGSGSEYGKRIHDEVRTSAFWRDIFAEYIATFFLVSVQAALPLSWDAGLGGVVQVSLGMGFIVTTIAWTLGDFGGAHMNPAVTICMALRLNITIVRAILYIVVQCLGSLTGAAFIYGMTPSDKRGRLAVTSLGPGVTPIQGCFLEAWITSIMVITILGSTNKRRKGQLFIATVPIGFSVTLGIMAAFMSTGASMNPARSLGPAIMMGLWEHHWVYWVGPIVGSSLAGLIYGIFDRVDISKFDQKMNSEMVVTKETVIISEQNINVEGKTSVTQSNGRLATPERSDSEMTVHTYL